MFVCAFVCVSVHIQIQNWKNIGRGGFIHPTPPNPLATPMAHTMPKSLLLAHPCGAITTCFLANNYKGALTTFLGYYRTSLLVNSVASQISSYKNLTTKQKGKQEILGCFENENSLLTSVQYYLVCIFTGTLTRDRPYFLTMFKKCRSAPFR